MKINELFKEVILKADWEYENQEKQDMSSWMRICQISRLSRTHN